MLCSNVIPSKKNYIIKSVNEGELPGDVML